MLGNIITPVYLIHEQMSHLHSLCQNIPIDNLFTLNHMSVVQIEIIFSTHSRIILAKIFTHIGVYEQ